MTRLDREKAGNIQGEPGLSCPTRKPESHQRNGAMLLILIGQLRVTGILIQTTITSKDTKDL